MTPSEFWKTSGYTIEPMKPRPTETPKPLNIVYTVSTPGFFRPVEPVAPHTTPRNVIRFPSGLEVEDMTDRAPRPLWPLVVSALLIWAAVIGAAWYLAM